jgi:hypothetical protein
VNGTLAEGTITAPDAGNGCGWADLAAVLAAIGSGATYVNVHTDDGVAPPTPGQGTSPAGRSAARPDSNSRAGNGRRARQAGLSFASTHSSRRAHALQRARRWQASRNGPLAPDRPVTVARPRTSCRIGRCARSGTPPTPGLLRCRLRLRAPHRARALPSESPTTDWLVLAGEDGTGLGGHVHHPYGTRPAALLDRRVGRLIEVDAYVLVVGCWWVTHRHLP